MTITGVEDICDDHVKLQDLAPVNLNIQRQEETGSHLSASCLIRLLSLPDGAASPRTIQSLFRFRCQTLAFIISVSLIERL